MLSGLDDIHPDNDVDPRENDDLRDDDNERSIDSDQADERAKLGELSDEDLTDDVVGKLYEITHDAKVTKEILKIGEGRKQKMGYKTWIKYKAYFFKDHLIFDESGDEPAELCLGDDSWPHGVQTGVEQMRVGEVAKIRIKKKHGFGRALKVDELKFPQGWSEGAGRERLVNEQIIYEVELIRIEVRQDIEANGIFYKWVEKPTEKHEWETPKDQDEIKVDFELKQGDKSLYKMENWDTDMSGDDPQMTLTIHRILESMKRDEKARIEIKKTFIPDEDKELVALLSDNYDKEQPVFAFVHLHRLVKTDDWFRDGTTKVRTLRKGKGRNPFVDSEVAIRLQVVVNGNQIVSNYPEHEPNLLLNEEE